MLLQHMHATHNAGAGPHFHTVSEDHPQVSSHSTGPKLPEDPGTNKVPRLVFRTPAGLCPPRLFNAVRRWSACCDDACCETSGVHAVTVHAVTLHAVTVHAVGQEKCARLHACMRTHKCMRTYACMLWGRWRDCCGSACCDGTCCGDARCETG